MHFFINPSNLPIQLPADRYGTVDTDQYRTSSKFALPTTANAYAMLSGNMIVQPCATDSDLLNIILKPIRATSNKKAQQEFSCGLLH